MKEYKCCVDYCSRYFSEDEILSQLDDDARLIYQFEKLAKNSYHANICSLFMCDRCDKLAFLKLKDDHHCASCKTQMTNMTKLSSDIVLQRYRCQNSQCHPNDLIDQLQNIDHREEVMYDSYVKCVIESFEFCENCEKYKISVINHDFPNCDCKT
jgi:hypothetical protein